MTWVILIECKGRYFIDLEDDKSIRAFDSEATGLAYFENGYNHSHARSYESSMSAAINWMTFRPMIVKSNGLEELKSWLESSAVHSIGNISGRMFGVEIKAEIGKQLAEGAKKPALITEDFNRIKLEQLRREADDFEKRMNRV